MEYEGVAHVLSIVHLPRRVWSRHMHQKAFSFIGFQGGAWVSAHIDDVHVSSVSGLTLSDAMSSPISDLFYNGHFKSLEEIDPEYAFENYRILKSSLMDGQASETQMSPEKSELLDLLPKQSIAIEDEKIQEDNIAEECQNEAIITNSSIQC